MKILYLGPEDTRDNYDYMSSTAFHGLRSLLGADVVDAEKQSLFYNSSMIDSSIVYGRGFTLTKMLDDIEVDRTDIVAKIKNRYFDYVIYGVARRSLDLFDIVSKFYTKDKIVFIDGEDDTNIQNELELRGWYFKRELAEHSSNIMPISFGIPKEKIRKLPAVKITSVAPLIPGMISTYIYKTEQEYYDMYETALFGLTWKKGGWDCIRHYEILASGCVPLFVDIHHCPDTILTWYPKGLMKEVFKLSGLILPFDSTQKFEYQDFYHSNRFQITNVNFNEIRLDPDFKITDAYEELLYKMHNYTKQNLTTEYVATYVLNTIRK